MKDLRRDLAAAEAGAAGDVEFLFLSIKRRLRDRDAIRREAIAKYVRVRAKARDFRSVRRRAGIGEPHTIEGQRLEVNDSVSTPCQSGNGGFKMAISLG